MGRLQVNPMMLGETEVGKERVAGFQERLHSLGVERAVALYERSPQPLCLVIGSGIVDQTQLFQDFIVSFLRNLVQHIAHLVHPTPLMATPGVDVPDSLPESIHAIADEKADPFDTSLLQASQEICP